ncbi:MAG: MarR family transcriptional regulator [Candidatus Sericytochromatia bacterium]|nr:MarR family transcriptional regulator [Candidatus Sericytochromatia bacterium]
MPTRFQGQPDQVQALDTFIKLMRASESFLSRLQPGLTAQGLTPGQFAVLEALLHLGPMHQREIGRKLLRSHANITTVLDNLEREGLIVRVRETVDRRFITVSLTPAGHDRITAVFPNHAAAIASGLACLETEEQAELGRLCKKLGLALTHPG